MDSQDHKMTATSTGHEGHGVHLCHRCGWPFPNPHPSAKHRRAHRRVCGTIEGYEVIHSEEHDLHLSVSDDEHASDGDIHTPSHNLVKINAEGSGRIVEKSNKSEDDVFTDAVTGVLDSGISPRLEEHFENVKELDKSVEQKGVGGDLYRSGSLKVDKSADRTEQSNELKSSEEMTNPPNQVNGNNQSGSSEEMTNPPNLVNGNNQSGSIIPTDSSADAVFKQVPMKSGEDADIRVQEDISASVTLDTEGGKISNHSLTTEGRQEELCVTMVSEVDKHDLLRRNEALQNVYASEGVNSTVHSAKISTSGKIVEVALSDETHENVDAFVGVNEFSHSTEESRSVGAAGANTLPQESLSSMPAVKHEGSAKTLDATEHFDTDNSLIDENAKPNHSLGGGANSGRYDTIEGEKCDMNGNENQNLESKECFSADRVPASDSSDKTFTPENDQTARAFNKDDDHSEENSNSRLQETGNGKGEGATLEAYVILDSTISSDNATDLPRFSAADGDARNSEELPKHESILLESREHGIEKSIPKLGTIGYVGVGSELNNDNGDALDKNSLPTSSLEEVSGSLVTSELPNNIYVTENVVRLQSTDVAETVRELRENNEVATSEKSPEPSISKDPTSLYTDSYLLSENFANDNSWTRDGAKESESVDTAEVTAKLDCEENVALLRETRESPTPTVQEAPPTSKCSNVTSPVVEESHSSEDFTTSKSVGIVSSAELDDNVFASDKCSVILNSNDPVPTPSNFQDLRETISTGDDKTLINVEDVNSKSLQAEVDDKLTKQNDMSGSSSGRSDSVEANCGSVVSDSLENNSQKHKTTTEDAHPDKSDAFEPPSFMTSIQSGGKGDQVTADVINESEGRKKHEEIIAKVTNWTPVKQQHGPLKNLLNEVKSPNTKQVPSADLKFETATKDNNTGVNNVGSVLGPETPATKVQDTNKDVEEWNSPARYPIENKKVKKKRSYWVPFVCCSST